MFPDLINGFFEGFGGVLIAFNCLTLYRDKMIRGTNIYPMVFFNAWGFWNLYFYPSVNCWFSFAGGCLIVTFNTVWVAMAVYYGRGPKQTVSPPPSVVESIQSKF